MITRLLDILSNFYHNFSAIRLIYSLILLALILAIGREFVSVWQRGKIVLSDFSYFQDGKKTSEHAEQLRDESIQNYQLIVALLKTTPCKEDEDDERPKEHFAAKWYHKIRAGFLALFRREEAPEQAAVKEKEKKTCERVVTDLLTKKADSLAQIDINIQGVNLKSILSTFSNFVSPQNIDIGVKVFESGGRRKTFVSVSGIKSNEPREDIYQGLPSTSVMEATTTDSDNAFQIACFLVWAQWNKTSGVKAPDTRNGIAFEEFSNWARLLKIRSELEAVAPYRAEKRKELADTTLVKEQFELAANLKIGIQEMYTSLGGMEAFVGSQPVKLGDKISTYIDAVVDIVRFFSLVPNFARDRRESARWPEELPSGLTGRQAVNHAYFGRNIKTEAESKARLRNVTTHNIVQITRLWRGRRIAATGIVVADGKVLTVAYGMYGDRDALKSFFEGATTTLLESGKSSTPLKVEGVDFVDSKRGSPFVVLTVPSLKLAPGTWNFDFSGPSAGFPRAMAVGFVRNSKMFFADLSSVPPAEADASDNDERYVLQGSVLEKAEEFSHEDDEDRFYLGIPFSIGLAGSPVYDSSGDIVGFIERGRRIGGNLAISVAVSIASLEGSAILKTLQASRKEATLTAP